MIISESAQEILNEIDFGVSALNFRSYKNVFDSILHNYSKTRKALSSNNIIVVSNILDPEYKKYIINQDLHEKEVEFHKQKRLILGKFIAKEDFGEDIIILFISSILEIANNVLSEILKRNPFVKKDEVYKDFILSALMHEHLHWYQALWMRRVGGEEFVRFVYREDILIHEYEDMIKEKEAFEYETLALTRYGFSNSKIAYNYSNERLNFTFEKDFKYFVYEFESYGHIIDREGVDFTVLTNFDTQKEIKLPKFFNSCENILKRSKGNPKLRAYRVNKLYKEDFYEIQRGNSIAAIKSTEKFVEWLMNQIDEKGIPDAWIDHEKMKEYNERNGIKNE